jgi:GR25 family glycosyltransferase involved in LPS biosynthesis
MTFDDLSKSIYVINLKEREDRKTHILNELKKIDCKKFIIFDAINGNSVSNPSRIKNGAYGLVQTYFKIYEDWKKDENENILLIEDDCSFVSDFNIKLTDYINNIPKNWDMVYFGGNHNYHMGNKTEKINDYCIKLNNTYSAHCVLLKKKVFEELISEIKKNPIEIDVMMSFLQKKYNSFSSSQKLTTQIPSFSNIENKHVDYDWLIK